MTPRPPLLSVVIPAYNAGSYLRRALHPLLSVTGPLEVIVVDDGSTDDTASIAFELAAQRPDLVRVVQQRNGGHGAAIEAGMWAARGTYFKVLDADDWLSVPALERVLETLAGLEPAGGVDALFTDYVHDRVDKPNRISRFDSVFPSERVFEWHETARFSKRQYLMMHAIIYRTDLLRASGLRMPRHTFYVDNLFVVVPLARVRRMYYLPGSLYHYFIGRADQSVNTDVMLSRVDQQLRVNRIVMQSLPTLTVVTTGEVPQQLYAALLHYVEAVCAVTSATLARGGTREHLEARAAFWSEIRRDNPWIYVRLRRGFMGASSNLPGQAGRTVTVLAYRMARRVVGFS